MNWIMDRLHVTPAERHGDGAARDAVCKFLQRDIDFRNCGLSVRAKGQVETLWAPIGNSSGVFANAAPLSAATRRMSSTSR